MTRRCAGSSPPARRATSLSTRLGRARRPPPATRATASSIPARAPLRAAADAPERQPLWLEMAQLNTRLGRERGAGLCWTRAVWEAAATDAAELSARWAQAESSRPSTSPAAQGRLESSRPSTSPAAQGRLEALATPAPAPVTALLALAAPDRDQIPALAAITSAGDGSLR